MMVTQERLKEALAYDHETGIFKWRKSGRGRKSSLLAGRIGSGGYCRLRIDQNEYQAHRLAWLYVHGEWPPNDIDHINHIKTDNRIINLRCATRSENLKNTVLHKNNRSGVAGVNFDTSIGKWQARVRANGRTINIGYFEYFVDAVEARLREELKHGYHASHGVDKAYL